MSKFLNTLDTTLKSLSICLTTLAQVQFDILQQINFRRVQYEYIVLFDCTNSYNKDWQKTQRYSVPFVLINVKGYVRFVKKYNHKKHNNCGIQSVYTNTNYVYLFTL